MKKRVLIMFFTGLLLSFVPFGLFSIEVDWISGNVTYSHLKSEWQDLRVGMDLGTGDIIKTGMNSETTLLDDGIEIHIIENTTFTISERFENDEKKSSFMLFLGRMKFKLARASKKEPEIQTQTVNLAIRGTEFEVGSGYDGSTLVLLSDGVVAVRGKTSELVLEKGEGTEVPFGEEPTEKFKLVTRIINWDEWFAFSKEAVKGNELMLLGKFLERFNEIDSQINNYEKIRAEAREKKEEYVLIRDELRKEGKHEEANEYAREANKHNKIEFHSLISIRSFALSSLGLYDLAEEIYSGVEKPTKELKDTFENVKQIYENIENKYIVPGDREMLEEKARKKRGCLKLF